MVTTGKKVSIPWLVRAYPGVEGFLDGLLGLDELLTVAVTRLAEGYFDQTITPPTAL